MNADFTLDRTTVILCALACVLGFLSTLAAFVLVWLIGTITNLVYFGTWSSALSSPADSPFGRWILVLPVAGGLISGLLARYGNESIRGHGIPEAMQAVLFESSCVSPVVAVLKPIATAIAIGSGCPFGAEGPIILTCGSMGSLVAQLYPSTASERKVLLSAGAAAGMSAIFASPVAATLLAVEVLLFEYKPRSLIPVALAASVAASTRSLFLFSAPLFPAPLLTPNPIGWGNLCWLLVGFLAGVMTVLLTKMLYAVEDAFGRLPLDWMWWSAIGGLVVGLGGLINSNALGVGYEQIAKLVQGNVSTSDGISLLFVKSVIWAVSLGSGTSGGTVAPLLMIGSSLGLVLGLAIPIATPGFWAQVSMGATLSCALSAPLTGIVFAVELTHNYTLLLPLLIACASSHLVTCLALDRSLVTEKIARQDRHVTREYSVDPCELLVVKDIMTPLDKLESVSASTLICQAIDFALSHAHHSYPVIDKNGALVGVLERSQALTWKRELGVHELDQRMVQDVVQWQPVTVGPNDVVARVVDQIMISELARAFVVERDGKQPTLVGLVSRFDLLKVRATVSAYDTRRKGLLCRRDSAEHAKEQDSVEMAGSSPETKYDRKEDGGTQSTGADSLTALPDDRHHIELVIAAEQTVIPRPFLDLDPLYFGKLETNLNALQWV